MTEEEALELAERVYEWLEKERIRHREAGPQVEHTLDEGEVARWPVQQAADDWVAARESEGSKRVSRERIGHWKRWATAAGIEFLDELSVDHADQFSAFLEEPDGILPVTRMARWKAARACMRWCVEVRRLKVDPWAGVRTPTFGERASKANRTLDAAIPIVHRQQRERLLAACRNTQERLLFLLYTLIGLRAREAVHLRWQHYLTHKATPQLAIRHCPERTFKVKTGERLVPVHYQEVIEALNEHRQTTTTGNGPDDWIIAKGNGEPYDLPPRTWINRLREETGIDWTPMIGRHTAASIFPLHIERLTGRKWTELEHAKYFGHDLKTSEKHYITEDLVDLAQLEEAQPNGSTDGDSTSTMKWPCLTPQLAKQLLAQSIETSGLAVSRLAEQVTATHAKVTDTAIRKFLAQGQSVPPLDLGRPRHPHERHQR